MNFVFLLVADRTISSTGSPITLMIRPRVLRPTGAQICLAVSTTVWPRETIVESMAMVRTAFSPDAGQLPAQVVLTLVDGGVGDPQGVVNRRQLAGLEFDVHNGADDLGDLTCVLAHLTCSSCGLSAMHI